MKTENFGTGATLMKIKRSGGGTTLMKIKRPGARAMFMQRPLELELCHFLGTLQEK